MSAFSIFQASFDGGLRPQHRRKGLFAAFAIKIAAVALAGGVFLTILHLNSRQLSDMANAGSPRDVRLSQTEATQNKSCGQQTWPFIEGRCLIDTRSLRKAERTVPRQLAAGQGLVSRDVALLHRKKRARAKTPSSDVAIASRAKAPQVAAATTGTAPRDEKKAQPANTTNIAAAAPQPATPGASPSVAKNQNATVSPRPQARVVREARHKERLTREQREARAEARSRRDEMRSASRNDYGYQQSYGGGWSNGPFGGGFFSTIR